MEGEDQTQGERCCAAPLSGMRDSVGKLGPYGRGVVNVPAPAGEDGNSSGLSK